MRTAEIWCDAQPTLLPDVLSAVLGRPVEAAAFARGPYGKPYLPAYPDLHFNLSHSGGLYAVVVSHDAPVGIDVECEREVREKDRICARYGLDPQRFFEDWTRREALVKARGTGIRELALPLPEGWYVESWTPSAGFAGAWAIQGEQARAIYRFLPASRCT